MHTFNAFRPHTCAAHVLAGGTRAALKAGRVARRSSLLSAAAQPRRKVVARATQPVTALFSNSKKGPRVIAITGVQCTAAAAWP